jgi:tetratricopeptide (TPR) repeat protein
MNEGVQLAGQRRYDDAAQQLERAASIDPTNDQALWNLALVQMEMQQLPRARNSLEGAISRNPTSAGYQEKLGTVLMLLEEWEPAEAAFRRAIELDGQLFKAHYKLGRVLERRGNPQEALREYTLAIQSGPRFIDGYRSLGRLYADLGYLDQSARVLQSGLEVVIQGTEDEAQLHHLLGTVHQERRDYDGAIQQFRAALDIVPSMRDSQFALGWTYALQNNRDEARRHLKQYIDSAGADAPRHYVKAAQDRLTSLGGP